MINLDSTSRDAGAAEPARRAPSGFALAAVLFVIVLLSALGLAAILTTGDERAAGRALRESAKAFYAAEAGLNAVVAGWDLAGYDTLLTVPGDSLDLGWQTLENGAGYRALVRRQDGGSGPRIFSITVTGRGPGGLGGQRVLSVVLRGTRVTITVDGTFKIAGNMTLGDGGGVVIDGNDNVPAGWESVCPPPGPPKPGLVMQDTTLLQTQDSPTIMGSPPLMQAPFDTLAFDALFDQLVAMADKVYGPGDQVDDAHQIVPAVTADGKCDTSVLDNWGAPEDPSHPCFDYFPIIYAPAGTSIKKQPTHSGQGILVADQGVEFENGFSFYGLVLAKGSVEVEQGKSGWEPANIYGALMTRNLNNSTKLWGPKWWPGVQGGVDVAGSSLFYSSCVMQRIGELALSSSGAPALLAEGAWSQAIN
jgi:hypothetical protein